MDKTYQDVPTMVFEQNEESIDYDMEQESSSEDTSMNDAIESAASSQQSLDIMNAAIAQEIKAEKKYY